MQIFFIFAQPAAGIYFPTKCLTIFACEREVFSMEGNLAYQYQDERQTELLNGKAAPISPRPLVNHNRVVVNIISSFGCYLRGKPCEAFADGTDVYLTEKDRVIPDVMIICDKNIIKRRGIYGALDLIVEVLSHGTEKRDRGYKKDLYESCGVGEYWLVDPEGKTVEAYLLESGKYRLDEVYKIFPDYVVFEPGEREEYKDEVKVSLYQDFFIPLTDIFENVL